MHSEISCSVESCTVKYPGQGSHVQLSCSRESCTVRYRGPGVSCTVRYRVPGVSCTVRYLDLTYWPPFFDYIRSILQLNIMWYLNSMYSILILSRCIISIHCKYSIVYQVDDLAFGSWILSYDSFYHCAYLTVGFIPCSSHNITPPLNLYACSIVYLQHPVSRFLTPCILSTLTLFGTNRSSWYLEASYPAAILQLEITTCCIYIHFTCISGFSINSLCHSGVRAPLTKSVLPAHPVVLMSVMSVYPVIRPWSGCLSCPLSLSLHLPTVYFQHILSSGCLSCPLPLSLHLPKVYFRHIL